MTSKVPAAGRLGACPGGAGRGGAEPSGPSVKGLESHGGVRLSKLIGGGSWFRVLTVKLLGQWNRDCGLDSRGRPAWALCCGPRADSMQAGPRPPRATGLGEGPLRTAATGPLSPGPALAWGGAWQTEGKSQRPQGSPARPLELGLWRQWRKITPCRKAGRTVTARLAAPEHRPPCFVSPRETRSGQAASLSLEGRQRDAPGGGARASEGAPVAQTRPRVPRPQPLLKKTGLWKQAGWALRHDAFVACGRWRNGH